jgi:predicted metal-dependent enzyme (double-stranded beta helix superfamily)
MAANAFDLEHERRPVGRTRTLRALTRSLDALVDAGLDDAVVAAHVGASLRPALADPLLLETRHCEPGDDRYRQHLVHVHPAGRYSIVALVWKPGQATPVHDHRCWCVVGVWRGLEAETTYELFGQDDPYVVPVGSTVSMPGDVSVLVPPDEDVHRVENCGETLAISVHVYGDDISVLGSSINRQFAADRIVVRPRFDDAPVSWRALDARPTRRRAA